MRLFLTGLLCAGLAAFALPAPMAEAGKISRACMQSDRPGATRQVCNCIQKVANRSLSQSDRRLASKFFSDPHMAQEIRQSDRHSHEVFWQKYRAFGEAAQASCG